MQAQEHGGREEWPGTQSHGARLQHSGGRAQAWGLPVHTLKQVMSLLMAGRLGLCCSL